MSTGDHFSNLLSLRSDYPTFSAQNTSNVSRKVVHSVIDGLLTHGNPLPDLKVLSYLREQGLNVSLVLVQHTCTVLDVFVNLTKAILDCRNVTEVRNLVETCLKGIANTANLLLDVRSLEEDDEDILHHYLSSFDVLDRVIINIIETHEAVTTGAAEYHAFETVAVLARYHTSNKSEPKSIFINGPSLEVASADLNTLSIESGISHILLRVHFGLLKDVAKLNLRVVLTAEGRVVHVELYKLGLFLLDVVLEVVHVVHRLTGNLAIRSLALVQAIQKGVDTRTADRRDLKATELLIEVAKLTFHLVASLDLIHIPALEKGLVAIQISELHSTHSANLRQYTVGTVLLKHNVNVLHVRRAEPCLHAANIFAAHGAWRVFRRSLLA
mmetsp:Transcript_20389/g.40097  ORF Transcript_20389/g.40097 Transcript_20389/m.40097 type:complete len:384 (+) Transcript_20389:767-1918(+)